MGWCACGEALSKKWVDMVAQGMRISQEIRFAEDNPDPLRSYTLTHPGEPGYFYIDTFMWKHMEQFKSFTHEGPVADLAMNLMRSKTMIFYFDFILIKQPGTSAKNPVALRRGLLAHHR